MVATVVAAGGTAVGSYGKADLAVAVAVAAVELAAVFRAAAGFER